MNRVGAYLIFLGTQNTGKSTVLKKFLTKAKRALILPANRMDSNWDEVEELLWEPILIASTGLMAFQIGQLSTDKRAADRIRFFHALGQALAAFDGPRKLFIETEPERLLFEGICDKKYGLRDATLVCDDFKNYIPSNNMPGYVKNLITDRRFKMLDLYFATHGPRMIPPDMFAYNPGIVLFGTTENFEMAQHKVAPAAYAKLIEAKASVDRRWEQGIANGTNDRFYQEHVELFGGVAA
jgi:hypothetical protein